MNPIISFSMSRCFALSLLLCAALSLSADLPFAPAQPPPPREPFRVNTLLGTPAATSPVSSFSRPHQAATYTPAGLFSTAHHANTRTLGAGVGQAAFGSTSYYIRPERGPLTDHDAALAPIFPRRSPPGGGGSTGEYDDLPLANGTSVLLFLAGLYLAAQIVRRRKRVRDCESVE